MLYAQCTCHSDDMFYLENILQKKPKFLAHLKTSDSDLFCYNSTFLSFQIEDFETSITRFLLSFSLFQRSKG